MEWSELIKIPKWTSIHKLGLDLTKIEDDFYKLSENQYCLSAPYDSMSLEEAPGGPFITSFLWACSEGAAKRVYLNEIESDDKVNVSPPHEILPSPEKKTYKEILNGLKELRCKSVMEHAGYRIVSDGAFIHRVIESEIASYFFRKSEHDSSEVPYAIQWNLVQV
jgi:hypothetical protein